jgi:hypothetical protein
MNGAMRCLRTLSGFERDRSLHVRSLQSASRTDPAGAAKRTVTSAGYGNGCLIKAVHLVVVPYDTLKFAEKQVMLPGGTKEGLRLLPEFKYATQ